jgi:hypothetical protein
MTALDMVEIFLLEEVEMLFFFFACEGQRRKKMRNFLSKSLWPVNTIFLLSLQFPTVMVKKTRQWIGKGWQIVFTGISLNSFIAYHHSFFV